MIFICNETSLQLHLKAVSQKGETTTELKLECADSNRRSTTILRSDDDVLQKELKRKYGNPRPLTFNPSKEFIHVANTKILINPVNNSLVVSETTDKNGNVKGRPNDLVKHIVVLVMHRGSRYYFPMSACMKSEMPTILPFGSDYTIALIYVKAFNWSVLTRPLDILVKSAGGEDHNLKFGLVSKKYRSTSGAEFTQNDIEMTPYAGEFPVPVKKSNANVERPSQPRRNDNSRKMQYSKTNSHNNNYHSTGDSNNRSSNDDRRKSHNRHNSDNGKRQQTNNKKSNNRRHK